MKKILSVALSTAMAFSMFASVAFGDTAVSPQQQFDALKAKGIFEGFPNGTAGLDQEMTRGQFAKVITKLLGLKEVTGQLSYNDKNYTAKNWAVPYIEAVTAAGIMEGKDKVKKIFDFNGKVTIAEMATILTRALDLEVPAETNNNAPAWAKGYVQAAINAGLIDAKANFTANASRQLLVGAAYSVDQAQSLKVASYEVSEAGKVVTFKISDGESVKVTLDKALEANKETEVKFTYKEKEFTEKVTYVVTTATKVESVTATNLKEITVNFDGSVDPTSAEQVALYSVVRDITGATANTIEKATVSADKKSVVLTVSSALLNNTAYKLSATGVKTGGTTSVSTKDVKFTTADVAAPTVDKVEALGNSAVKVTFSEPVNITNKSAASNYFEIDGKVVSGTLDVNSNTVIIKSFTKLANGDHKIVTKKAIQDYAGYPVLEKTFDFTVTEDTTAPTIAGVSNVTFESATVTFSEDVDPSTVSGANIYWLDGSQKRYAESGYEKQIDGKTFKFSFTGLKKLPSYATDLYINNVKDYSGNQIVTDSKTTVNAVIDQTRPEVASFTFNTNTNKSAVLKFTKAVDTATFLAKNVVIKDSTGKAVTNIFTPAWSDANKTLTINFSNALKAGTYSFELTGLKDTTTLANTILPYTGEITVGDIAQPKLVSTVKTDSSFILNFDKKMALDGEGSILNPANYYATYNVDGNAAVTGQLPAGTSYETLADQKSVLIKLPANVKVTALTVQGVRSAAGNVLNGYVANALDASVVVDGFTVKDAKAIATNEIVVKLTQPAASAIASDYVVTVGAVTKSATDAWVDASDNTLVHVKLADNTLNTAVTGVKVDVKATGAASQSLAGAAIKPAAAAINVKDAIKASVVKNADDKIVIAQNAANVTTNGIVFNSATNTIWVNFTEDIQAANEDVAGQLFKVTQSDGTELKYGAIADYTATISGSTVTIKLNPSGSKVSGYNGIYRIAFNNDSKYVTDKATGMDFDGTTPLANAVSNFNVEDDAVNNNAIVINNAVTATATFGTTNQDEITVSFNKAVDATTLADTDNYTSAGKTVVSATPGADNKSVVVKFSANFASAESVVVSDIKDADGNVIATATFTKQ
ncbi:Ig-like domain-containing protein [Paenibacillus amylolyticus]|uniref:Ig-like domain-containing protein n=1 Tax=Paenibacillus amylolyticus TaxID=1451 RepID=UPI003EB7DB0B